jgi:hypothetical protein
MPVLLIYLLKTTVCSGILLGYYWLALRNKIYHGYNRFYLLTSVIISLIVPFIEFDFTHYSTRAASSTIKILQVVGSGNEYLDEIIVTAKANQLSGTQLAGLTYTLISLVFIAFLVNGLLRIRKLYKENLRTPFGNICIVDTTARDSPFSFFNLIFWNSGIDMDSETGRQVLKHELVHVREKHSIDKIFINVILAALWCNPFFWLIRRELNMIHEFIADKKSLREGDTATLALMILQTAYPLQNFPMTNQFFYSPIKRRLAMITKSKHSKAGYIARLLALPLFLFIVSAFTIKTKIFKQVSPAYENRTQLSLQENSGVINLKADTGKAKMDDRIAATAEGNISIRSVKGLVAKTEFGRQAMPEVEGEKIDTTPLVQIRSALLDKNGNRIAPLYIIDGIEKPEKEFNSLSPDEIKSITVLKNESAVEKYGEKARNGVIILTTKTEQELKEVVVVDYGADTNAEPVFTKVENEASFPGGEEGWRAYLIKNLDAGLPSKDGWKKGIYKIIIQFIVNKNGEISDVKAINYEGTKTAEHCINLIKKGPKWNPALQNGHPVNSYKKQPIAFVVEYK